MRNVFGGLCFVVKRNLSLPEEWLDACSSVAQDFEPKFEESSAGMSPPSDGPDQLATVEVESLDSYPRLPCTSSATTSDVNQV